MVAVVVILFTVTALPYHIYYLYHIFTEDAYYNAYLWLFVQSIAYLYTAIKPYIYVLMVPSFRGVFCDMVRVCKPKPQ